ncbi:O-methyltransferase [Pusillimonas sp. SM2304]|uniref:O-methyltransferase n=1 Tax=Pusillimonas sp. SM2304 TaxID=3073241 RepID=UPI002874C169|nr:O-methyltransferase [Pusillimonas sp. SM2304]MDS1141802.1 O-methyltransferase [Pusillimonas sp. SM2304]
MNQAQWNIVDDYFSATLAPSDPVLDAALDSSQQAGLPAINVAPNQGKFLHLLARISGARRILEIGTLGGYSTIWLARALPAGGALVTLELEPAHAQVARQNIQHAGFSDKVSVMVGNAVDTLENLVREQVEPFDFVFIDADKQNNPLYLEWSLKLAKAGTVIVTDNVVRKGGVADPDNHDPDVEGVRSLFAMAGANPRLSSTAIQTVGAKGWDGFAITVVSD